MNTNVRKMLERMYNLLTVKYKNKVNAWDYFIEFLAADNSGYLIYQLNHKFEWLVEDKQLAKSIMAIYDPALLKSDYYDHLGDMYLEKILCAKKLQSKDLLFLTMDKAFALAENTIKQTDGQKRILDPVVGTGRYLMAVHKINPNNLLFGVDTDLRALRIAFTNFAIHGILGYLLHADNHVHAIEIDTDEGIYNWKFANRWYSCIDKLKTKIEEKGLS